MLQCRISNSALKQQHPRQLVSDVEDERVVRNELGRPERRHQRHPHPRGRGRLAARTIEMKSGARPSDDILVAGRSWARAEYSRLLPPL